MKQKGAVIFDWMFLIVGMGMFLYHMMSTQYLFLGAYEHQNTHLAFFLALIFINTIRESESVTWKGVQLILIILGLSATLYVFFNIFHLCLKVDVLKIGDILYPSRKDWGRA